MITLALDIIGGLFLIVALGLFGYFALLLLARILFEIFTERPVSPEVVRNVLARR